ncbi:DMT family transporter [Streptomyces griseoloalbus]|uniref:Quaternary ammonium compound-resistance protein SugE n=1 Tax=Streptomyces griseoloalbus TaxID=67303 RepID=A0A7W8F9R6_9ACTN|nr:multidrug efflux SMR transporter [Streptomyces albaduncus]MBB5128403.1 quaternary ammonium compound-resistance protein SugE [Streptomyces albaduncus]GGV70251.1 QacE family quaternary ammonium compound efflux SMR transporter [Streptomyces griseoloalbus]GGW74103.1 QacE family quaternary ammonium compound efflux SMR transporter [Streptomyces albaduncus]
MAWTVLIASGVLEAVWATALGMSQGFRRPGPTLVFLVTSTLSMAGLSYAMTSLPTGSAYAVWVGIGTVLTVAVAAVRGQEKLTPLRGVLLAGLIGCVIGLKAVS